MKNVLNGVLFFLLVAIVCSTWFLRRDYGSRNTEILPGMVVSVPYDAQGVNENFGDGKTLRAPVLGTIPRQFTPVHYQSTPEAALQAGEELRSPFSDSAGADLHRGEMMFSTFCSPCHGAAGLGDGTVVRKGFPPPPSLLAVKAMNMKDGQMFHILTFGQGNMPSLASQIQQSDRWQVIRYVRSIQQKSLIAGK